jgi:hypothetical protein
MIGVGRIFPGNSLKISPLLPAGEHVVFVSQRFKRRNLATFQILEAGSVDGKFVK